MRYLVIVVSIYMTFLALMPCQDNNDMAANPQLQTSVQKNQPGNEQCGQESCTPFCTCSCCSTVRQLTAGSPVTVFTKLVTRIYPDYEPSSIRKQAIKIWQPPQIG
jgi:hypothetical protein